MIISITPNHTFSYNKTQCLIYYANKGEGLTSHAHTYNHGTICLNGKLRIKTPNNEVIVTKDSGAFNLVAPEYHEIEALEDNTIFMNIFAEQINNNLYGDSK